MAGRDCALVAFDSPSPLIVLTNDDGVSSPGLAALKTALDPLGEVRIVAPDQNRSGAARSITMHSPLWVEEVQPGRRQPGLQHRRHPRGLRAHGGAGTARPRARPHSLGHQPGRQPGRRHHLLGHGRGRLRGHHAGHPGHRHLGRGLPPRLRPHGAGAAGPAAGVHRSGPAASRPRPCSTSTVPTGPGTSWAGCG